MWLLVVVLEFVISKVPLKTTSPLLPRYILDSFVEVELLVIVELPEIDTLEVLLDAIYNLLFVPEDEFV